MRWDPTPYGFTQFLSKDIPDIVQRHVKGFVESICKQCDIDINRDKSQLIFAIHPGGSKILDAVEKELETNGIKQENTIRLWEHVLCYPSLHVEANNRE